MVLIEAAVARVEDAFTAQEAGADRIELSCALELGGLTPPIGMVRELTHLRIPMVVLVRPRPGGFDYSQQELLTMQRDIEALLEAGAKALAIGALCAGGISQSFIREVIQIAGGADIIFHRAFDLIPTTDSLDQLIVLGVKRVLTSGGAPTALAGADRIRQLITHAAGRIEILPAAGISPENAAQLVRLTGCTQLHGTFSEERFDDAGVVAPGAYRATSADKIRALRNALAHM